MMIAADLQVGVPELLAEAERSEIHLVVVVDLLLISLRNDPDQSVICCWPDWDWENSLQVAHQLHLLRRLHHLPLQKTRRKLMLHR